MRQINFKSRAKMIVLISFIETIFLIGLIIGIVTKNIDMFIFGFIVYIIFKVLENIIWRCPKCKVKLPKGKYTDDINKCSYCNYELL